LLSTYTERNQRSKWYNNNMADMKKVEQKPNPFEVAKDYVGLWVALSEDNAKVIASGKTLKEVSKKIASVKVATVFRVPEPVLHFMTVGR
jgi:hypothetical protein